MKAAWHIIFIAHVRCCLTKNHLLLRTGGLDWGLDLVFSKHEAMFACLNVVATEGFSLMCRLMRNRKCDIWEMRNANESGTSEKQEAWLLFLNVLELLSLLLGLLTPLFAACWIDDETNLHMATDLDVYPRPHPKGTKPGETLHGC